MFILEKIKIKKKQKQTTYILTSKTLHKVKEARYKRVYMVTPLMWNVNKRQIYKESIKEYTDIILRIVSTS